MNKVKKHVFERELKTLSEAELINQKKKLFLRYIDHTNLDPNISAIDFQKWLNKYRKYLSDCASVCIFDKYIPLVRNLNRLKQFNKQKIRIATVLNFPSGSATKRVIYADLQRLINKKVDEIDFVIDYHQYIATGESLRTVQIIEKISKILKIFKIKFKIILEVGELESKKLIKTVLADVLVNDIDFIKTSTGKNKLWTDAQLHLMIKALQTKNRRKGSKKFTGIKISGNVKTFVKAFKYAKLIVDELGDEYKSSDLFRIGSSSLLDSL